MISQYNNSRQNNAKRHNGAPASALDIHIEGEDTPRKIISTSLPESLAAVTTTPLGKITVTNNRLAFTFLGGHADYWTLIHSIELFPEGFDAPNMQDKEEYSAPAPEEAAEYHELIRGLGYL